MPPSVYVARGSVETDNYVPPRERELLIPRYKSVPIYIYNMTDMSV